MYKATLYAFEGCGRLFGLEWSHPSVWQELRCVLLKFHYQINSASMLDRIRHAAQLLGVVRHLDYLEVEAKIGSRHQIHPEDWTKLQRNPGCLVAEIRHQDEKIGNSLANAMGPERSEVTIQGHCPSLMHRLLRSIIARTAVQ